MFRRSSKCTARDQLHAKIAKYAFPSFVGVRLYLIGPAKSDPMTSKAAPPVVVQSCGSLPGAGLVNAVARKRIHPLQFLRTDLTKLRSFGTQYCSRIAAMVNPTPP